MPGCLLPEIQGALPVHLRGIKPGDGLKKRTPFVQGANRSGGPGHADAEVSVELLDVAGLLLSGIPEKGKEKLGLGGNHDPGMAVQRLLDHGGPGARAPQDKELVHDSVCSAIRASSTAAGDNQVVMLLT